MEIGNSEGSGQSDAAPAQDLYGCIPVAGITAESCSAQGCQIGAPPYCSGVAPPPDYQQERQPCECVCPAEIERCSEMP